MTIPSEENEGYSCHYCLETYPFTPINPDWERGSCPICHHNVLAPLLGIPIHLFNREQQWNLLVEEMDYIDSWERGYTRSYKHATGGDSYDYIQDKAWVERIEYAKTYLKNKSLEILSSKDPLEEVIDRLLKEFPDGDGSLGRDIREGREWRMKAAAISRKGLALKEVIQFQQDYVKALNWCVFDNYYSEGKGQKAVLERLEERLKVFC